MSRARLTASAALFLRCLFSLQSIVRFYVTVKVWRRSWLGFALMTCADKRESAANRFDHQDAGR